MNRLVAVSLGFLVVLALVGCSDDKVTIPEPEPDPSPYLAPTSPANLLDNLRTAMELRDPDAYAALFDPEEFVFRFDPVDLRDQPDLPASWGFQGETTWSRRAFESPNVLDISLSFIKGAVQDVDESDGAEVDLSWKKSTITGVQLEIETRNPDDPTDNIIYKVSGDRALFFFVIDPDSTIGGEPVWQIVEWRDIRVGARPVPA